MRKRQNLSVILTLLLGLLTGGFASAQGIERPTQVNIPAVGLRILGTEAIDAGAETTYVLEYDIIDFGVSDLTLSFPLPPQAVVLEYGNGTMNDATQSINWHFDAKDPGTYRETVTVSALTPTPDGTVLSVLASLDSAETEPIYGELLTRISSAPRLSYERSIDAPFLQPGGESTVTLRIQNSGSDAASGVSVHEKLAEGLRGDGQQELHFPIGALEAGQSVSLSYQITAEAGLAPGNYTGTIELSGSNLETVVAESVYTVKQPIVLGVESNDLAEGLDDIQASAATTQGQVLGAATEELSPTGIGFWDWLLLYAAALLLSLGITAFIFLPPQQPPHEKMN